ncbi:SHOCT domain-containing protein [Dactylosporangium sp. NPDC048998]|uniref:SHOCT domain-containing protein n=1 Tax=Dactylosporangium sp. NPDC048998 TaxID=3363976 RepID=UPI0037199C18
MPLPLLIRRSVYTFIGLAGAFAGLTMLFLASRLVLAMGGRCGSGGTGAYPYPPCPEHVPELALLGLFGGAACTIFYAVKSLKFGARLSLLPVPVLFLSMAWNFFEFGFDPPGGGLGIGWLICGVVFVVMGAGPLFMLGKAFWRENLWADWQPPAEPTLRPLAGLTPLENAARARTRALNVPDAGAAQAAAPDPAELASALERVSQLHAAGKLTDAEYTAAKLRLLGLAPEEGR